MTATAFNQLALDAAMLANLAQIGYSEMTPIQAQSLPHLLAGRDVIAQAKTGSGKTAAFGIGLLSRLNPRYFGTQALVLCPTRELAEQVTGELRRLARFAPNIKVLTLGGGVAMGPQLASLEHGAHVVVGTPGRIMKHLAKGSLQLKGLNTLVLDEADRMLDMGFHPDMVEIIRHTPASRQTLLFSATYPPEIEALSGDFQCQPVRVEVESLHAENHIEQRFYEVEPDGVEDAIAALLAQHQPASAVLFCNTRQRCDEISRDLRQRGHRALPLHGDLEQWEREQVFVQFRNGSSPLLVATDVAARGLDIKELAAVINVELAFDPEVHVHRIGRTGRAGAQGLALSLCTPAEAVRAAAIEDYTGQPLRWKPLPAPGDGSAPALPAVVTLEISGGRKDKLRPGDILGALTGDGGLQGNQIGKIDVLDTRAFVAVAREAAPLALDQLQDGKIKGRRFKARRLGK